MAPRKCGNQHAEDAPRIRIRAMTSGGVSAACDLLEQLGYLLTVTEAARRFVTVAAFESWLEPGNFDTRVARGSAFPV